MRKLYIVIILCFMTQILAANTILTKEKLIDFLWGPADKKAGSYISFFEDDKFILDNKYPRGAASVIKGTYQIKDNNVILKPETLFPNITNKDMTKETWILEYILLDNDNRMVLLRTYTDGKKYIYYHYSTN